MSDCEEALTGTVTTTAVDASSAMDVRVWTSPTNNSVAIETIMAIMRYLLVNLTRYRDGPY